MERIAIAGLSLNEAEVSDLEALRVSGKSDAMLLRDLADDLAASEVVHLVTCNRVEVVFAREEGQAPGPEDLACVERALCANGLPAARMRFFTGRDAVQHLFRVVSSLDSLVQGEDQILSQVREAYGRARDIGLTGTILEPVFKHAFQIGKQVRTRTDLSRHSVSVMSLGVGKLAEALEGIDSPSIAIIGAGSAAHHAARSLRGVGLGVTLVVNRTIERARELARKFDANAMTLDEFRATLATIPKLDAVVSATSATGYVLDASELAVLARGDRRGHPFVGLDLAVPRDFEPSTAGADHHAAIAIIDLESLRETAEANRELRAAAAAEADELIQAKLKTLERKGAEQRAAAMINAYLADGNELLERQLSELRSPKFDGLDSDALRNVERWARSTFSRLAHLPIAACKQLARELPNTIEPDGPDQIEEGETTG